MLAIELLNSTSTCLTKISILFFYRRLGRGTYTTFFLLVVQTNIALIAAYLVSFSIVLVMTCRPVAAYWLQFSVVWTPHHAYRCVNEAATTVAANAVSIAQDLVACGLPSVLLWKLQMGRRKKVLLGGLLGLGIVPCIAGLLRLLYTVRLYADHGYDATWSAHPVLLWTAVETHLGILCACAPALHSYAKEAAEKAPAWLRPGSGWWSVCAGTMSFFRYLSSRSSMLSSSLSSSASASFFRRGGGGGDGRGKRKWKRRRRRSASGHVELEESLGVNGGGDGGGRGGGGGGGREFGAREGKQDGGGGGGGKSAGTLLSSLSTLDEAGSEHSIMAIVEGADRAADDRDLERGFFAQMERREDWDQLQLQQIAGDEQRRRREAGVDGLSEASLVGMPERLPAAYLGPYRQQQRYVHQNQDNYCWRAEDEAPLSTASSSMRGDRVSQEEIGVAITTDPPTAPELLYDRWSGGSGIEGSRR
ncbi:hypothetical protein BK809_0003724 [Diplodia seriata]|uniref:Rhodopsin domain-containing protein n=1 Tax=Diplodia seriata TaxID=420778 RepID=A0A1S8BGC1_9PEZI|nr:hypothetical protein BK809_0003724 [Diplodia seriata]